MCVFFRNNHFCTMCRYDGELYILVTDVGFYDQPVCMYKYVCVCVCVRARVCLFVCVYI